MAKSVSGKLVLLSNILVFVFGIFLVLIIVGTNPPPSSSSVSSTTNNRKYITIKTTDIYSKPTGVTYSDPIIVTVITYNGPNEIFENRRQTLTLSQQETALNVVVQPNDLITAEFSQGTNKLNKISYNTQENYDSLNTLYVTWYTIVEAENYVSRQKLKTLWLSSYDTEDPKYTSELIYKAPEAGQTLDGVYLVSPDRLYESNTVTQGGDNYNFTSQHFGSELNFPYISTRTDNLVNLQSLGTTEIVFGSSNINSSGSPALASGPYFMQLCCSGIACEGTDFSGPGDYTTYGFTADDLCAAAAQVQV